MEKNMENEEMLGLFYCNLNVFLLWYCKKPMVTYQDIKSKPYFKQMLRYVEEHLNYQL